MYVQKPQLHNFNAYPSLSCNCFALIPQLHTRDESPIFVVISLRYYLILILFHPYSFQM